MSTDSDLYGEDIRLWSERQGNVLRKLAAGEAVRDHVNWPHVIGEIEDLGHENVQHVDRQQEINRLTARLATAEALANELRARLEALTCELSDRQLELAAARDEADAATARALAATETEKAIREADAERRRSSLWVRLRAAWWGE